MNLGILIFPDVEELDFAGPWEMAGMWNKLSGIPERQLVVAQSDAPLTCSKGLLIVPHVTFEQCPHLDVLLVPGGQGTRKEVENPVLINFIEEQAKNCKAVLSVCTGAFLLHKAGLLSGMRATTHWASLDRLRALGDVIVIEERVVHDGNIWTSAGYRQALISCLLSLKTQLMRRPPERSSLLPSTIHRQGATGQHIAVRWLPAT